MRKEKGNNIIEADDIPNTRLDGGIELDTHKHSVTYTGCRADGVVTGSGSHYTVEVHTGAGISFGRLLKATAYDIGVSSQRLMRGKTQTESDANIAELPNGIHRVDLSLVVERKAQKAEASVDEQITALQKKQRKGNMSMAEMARLREFVLGLPEPK